MLEIDPFNDRDFKLEYSDTLKIKHREITIIFSKLRCQ